MDGGECKIALLMMTSGYGCIGMEIFIGPILVFNLEMNITGANNESL
tara:strand:+ start:49 stop:189 length:141 start_codon:yes stop_codon:yes gene_type:complete